jgi:protein dithiol oxidoreductase (disulfide-forming)
MMRRQTVPQRDNKLLIAVLTLVTVVSGFAPPAAAAVPVEGIDYQTLEPTIPIASNEITVAYFFSYYCAACADLAPRLHTWAKQQPLSRVRLRHVVTPILSQPGKEPAQQTHEAMRAIDPDGKLQIAVLNAIRRQGQSFASLEAFEQWLQQSGASLDAFRASYATFGIASQARNAQRLLAASIQTNLNGVPAVVVDGKYFVVLGDSKQYDKKFATLDWLIARELSARAASGAPVKSPGK